MRRLNLISILCLLAALAAPALGADIDADRYQAHLEALTATPHRLAGTEEGARAGAYIEDQLGRLGNGDVLTQRFRLPQEDVELCEIRLPGGALTLAPMVANGMQPSVTDRDGTEAPIIYAGQLRFTPGDVLDWERFTAALDGAQGDTPAAHIARTLREAGVGGDPAAMAAAVDALLPTADLYGTEAFRTARLRPQTRRMVRRRGYDMTRNERARMNRLLLEDTFPELISRGFDGKTVEGRIVLLDFGARQAMVEAFRLGARAVIFVKGRRDVLSSAGRTATVISIDMPRFYVSADAAREAGLFTADTGTLISRVGWKRRMGKNVFFFIRGAKPIFQGNQSKQEEVLILSAYYDTKGIVPTNSPDQEAAANCAALLETARRLSENPPRRSVFIAFFDGHHNYMAGGRAFYAALRRSIPERINDTLWKRLEYIEDERLSLKVFDLVFQHVNLLSPDNEEGMAQIRQSGLVSEAPDEETAAPVDEEEGGVVGAVIFNVVFALAMLSALALAVSFARSGRDGAAALVCVVAAVVLIVGVGLGFTTFWEAKLDRSNLEAYIDRARDMFADEAKYGYNIYMEDLTRRRLENHNMAARIDRQQDQIAELKSLGENPEQRARLEAEVELFKGVIARNSAVVSEVMPKQKGWQIVREAIRDLDTIADKTQQHLDKAPNDASRALVGQAGELAKTFYPETLASARERIRARLQELDELEVLLHESIAAVKPLSEATVSCHVSYRFTAGSDRWLFIPFTPRQHLKLFAGMLDAIDERDSGTTLEALNYVTESRQTWEADTAAPSSYIQWQTQEEAHLGGFFQIPSMALLTEQDPAWRTGMPDVTFTRAELARIRGQAEHFMPLLDGLAGAEWASVLNRITANTNPYIDEYSWEGNKADGHQVRSFGYGDAEASKVEGNVLVHLMNGEKNEDYFVYANANGHFPFSPVVRNLSSQGDVRSMGPNSNWVSTRIEAGRFDKDGRIVAITTARPTGGYGSTGSGWANAAFYRPKAEVKYFSILNMFDGVKGRLLGGTLPLDGNFNPGAFRVLGGLNDAQLDRLHFRFDEGLGVGVYQAERPLGMKFIYNDPKNTDDVAFYLNATDDRPVGIGFGPGNGRVHGQPRVTIDLREQVAPDIYMLNESRLDALRKRNIVLNMMEFLHSQAKFALERFEATRAGETRDHAKATTLAVTVASLERRVYKPVMDTTQDMVSAVTILLLLAIPFAFSMQSLVLPTYSIYRKIAGFVLFFAVSFLLLYYTHPAFKFSATPVVIILAFVIMVMSGLVIWIVGDKFNYEIKKLQGLATAAHTFSKSLFGNVGAAVSLAISIMQRRPVRTFLTVFTVLLLTFTILSFVAFQEESGINPFYLGPADDEVTRIMLHNRVWKTMGSTEDQWRDYVSVNFGEGYEVHGRYWLTRELSVGVTEEELYIPIRHQGGASAVAGAIMSLDAIELRRLPELRDVFNNPENLDSFLAGRGIFTSKEMAAKLDARPGDTVRLQGRDLTFLGTFDNSAINAARQVDGSPFMPVNFGVSIQALGAVHAKGSAGGGTDAQEDLEKALEEVEPEALEPVSPTDLVIAPSVLAADLKMALKAVVVYPEAGKPIEKLAERLCLVNFNGCYVNEGGERSYLYYGERIGVRGVADVLIPLILGGLIVFSTMLGSIIDREREIYTFSALGLAPKNIAMLFFVEAAIYAVIGGFGGYLFSQGVTKFILEPLAEAGIFRAPEMNYSSTTVIRTILLVMATVIVSTIYPALKAAKRATADTMKHWHVPSPKGNVCEFDFPFTISRYDITGIICFIREHFANHADRTVGKFAADHVEIGREPEYGMATLSAHVWLQPFDQGISQTFELAARPSDIPEVCEIHVTVKRLSGPPSAWKRSYSLFFEDLRSQFLLWRTLDDAAREHYLDLADEVEDTLGITATQEPADETPTA